MSTSTAPASSTQNKTQPPLDVSILYRKNGAENITPHRLTVSILINEYFKFRDHDKSNNELSRLCTKNFCVLVLKLIHSPDINLEELRNILITGQFKIHKKILKSFDETLNKISTEKVTQILEVMSQIKKLILRESDMVSSKMNMQVHKSSIAGFYLRRLILNFEKLDFSQVTKVVADFEKYYWANRISENVTRRRLKVIEGEDWYLNRDKWSRRQAELFIALQAKFLSSCEEKAFNPKELNKHLLNILKSNPSFSAAHFANYLNYLRVKDFCGALNSLHHCFDRTYDAEHNVDVSKKQSYRFASLTLAILHYQFGHKNEALTCLKEAMTLAQEANDIVCLQHILTWMYSIKDVGKDKFLQHSIMKSLELNMMYLVSLGILNFGQYAGVSGGTPKYIFATLTRGDMFNCQHPHNSLTPDNYAQRAALWLSYGKIEMSALWSQLSLFLNCGSNFKLNYSRSICLAMCNVGMQFLFEGEIDLAFSTVMLITSNFSYEPLSHCWMMCESFCKFTKALYMEHWLEAENAARNMAVYDVHESNLKLAEVFIQKHDFVTAQKYIQKILLPKYGLNHLKIDLRVRAMIMLGEISYITSYPNIVMPNIFNNCLTQANEFFLDYWESIVYLHIAYVLFLMGLPAQALKIFDKRMVHILSHGSLVDRARAILLYVKCLLANSTNKVEEERMKVVSECCNMLEDVYKSFCKIQAHSRIKEVLFLQAQLYNELGKTELRNKCAWEFRTVENDHPSPNKKIAISLL